MDVHTYGGGAVYITYGDLLGAVRGSDDSVAISLSADSPFNPPLRRIYVGGAGNVKVDTPNHTGVTYQSVAAGTYVYCRATKVYSSSNGTSATNLIGEY